MSVLPGWFLEEEQKVDVVVKVSCFASFPLPTAIPPVGLTPGLFLSLPPKERGQLPHRLAAELGAPGRQGSHSLKPRSAQGYHYSTTAKQGAECLE